MRAPHKLLPLLLITTALLATACRKPATAMEAAGESGAVETDASAAPEAPQVKLDYWKPLAAYLAGDYSATCMEVAKGPERHPYTIKVGADGQYQGGQFSGDIRKSDNLIINRSHEKDGSIRVMLTASSDKRMFTLMSGDRGKGRVLNLSRNEGEMLACDETPAVLGLSEKPLHVVFGAMLNKAPMTLTCVSNDHLTGTPVRISLADGIFTVGDRKYPLAQMDEVVMFKEGLAELTYTAALGEEASVAMALDASGKVITVIQNLKDKGVAMCSSQK